MLSEVATTLLDAYREALDLLSAFVVWLESLLSLSAVLWYAFGLLTPLFVRFIRIRYGYWRVKSRLARRLEGHLDGFIAVAVQVFSKAYPKAPLKMTKEELHNVENLLLKIILLGSTGSPTDWKRLWFGVDSSWMRHLLSKGCSIKEPIIQEAMARTFLREANAPGGLNSWDIDILATTNPEDWKMFTIICGFACWIDGRITPVVFDLTADVYKAAGIEEERLAGLVAAGLITQGGTGDVYTLKMPEEGMTVRYFDEKEWIVRPLLEPIPRTTLGITRTRPHPFDKNLNVGVLDFTQVGRALGFVTACRKVQGFTEYLNDQWKEYLRSQDSLGSEEVET